MKNKFNKLVLGTVQLGMNYGINNSTGQPRRPDVLAMLALAYEKGIKIFDTAYAYGDAEEILGEFIESRDLGSEIKIITKLKPDIVAGAKGKINDIIFGNLKESLGRLKRNYVDGYLLHTPEYIREDKIVSALVSLKKQGLVKNIGVSVYKEADAIYAAKLKGFDYIQVPYNIFDQRLDKTDFFKLTKTNGITVFARSAFLQGLLLMPENKVPSALAKAKKYLRQLDKIIGQYNFSRLAAALMFSLNNNNLDYLVFGADNRQQLLEIIGLAEKPIDFLNCARELKEAFVNMEKDLISPNLWKR